MEQKNMASNQIGLTQKQADKILFYVISGMISCLTLVLYVPFFSQLFHLAPISLQELLIIGAVSFVGLLWFEVLKVLRQNNKVILET